MLNSALSGMQEGWQFFGFAGLLFLSLIGGAAVLAVIQLIRVPALGQQNRRLKTALNYMSQGLCVWDADTKLLLFKTFDRGIHYFRTEFVRGHQD